MTKSLAIQEWVKRLTEIPEHEFTLERVLAFVRETKIRPETLQPYQYFSKANYTRNLIFKNHVFEVMAICWEIGQVSRIHNHRDQNCWMVVPIGRLRVQNFRVEDRDPVRGTCRLLPSDSYEMHPDNPGVVQPHEPVHQVLNLPEFNQRAVSIHVYSRPFLSCEVYSLEKGIYCDVPLFYTSEYGKLVNDEKLL
jgi:cysteine dioxygenase